MTTHIVGLITLAFGLVAFFFPRFIFFMNEGWKFRGDIEPSDFYITMTKIAGAVCIVFGLISAIMPNHERDVTLKSRPHASTGK